jgi:heat shock protein HtpX
MSEPILTHARNIYEQQTHNRRITWLLMIAFILLIAAIGIGFDVFLNVSLLARIIILPFVILMVGSGIWNFQQRAAEGLWKKPKEFADDDDVDDFSFVVPLIVWSFVIVGLLCSFFFYPRFFKSIFDSLVSLPVIRYIPIGTTLTVIIGIVSILTSLGWGKNSVLWSVNADQPDDTVANLPGLLNVVQEISLAAGIQRPSVYIVKDSDPNAFTVGSNTSENSLVLTTGLLSMLDREELQGVIAHEISHIRNSDTSLMTIITVLFGAVLLLSGWMKKSALFGGFAGGRIPGVGWVLRSVLFTGWILTMLLAPLIARIVAMAVSREREYLADASGAELTRNPKALAPTTSFHNGIAHLCVVDPLGKKINTKEGWWADLFATHPPMKNRILILNAMAYQSRAVTEHTAQ